MLIDAHTHIFEKLRGRVGAGPVAAADFGRATVGSETVRLLPPLCRTTSFPTEALLASMDWAGVNAAMLLQGPFYGDQNREVLDAAEKFPDRFRSAAFLDPWVNGAREAFAQMASSGKFHALKLECSVPAGFCGLHPHARLDAPELRWLWEELERRRLVLVLDLGAVGSLSYQTRAVREIAATHPRLKIVIPHLAQIRPEVVASPELLQRWCDQIDLGRLPNVWFDSASLPAYCDAEGYPYPSVGEFLRRAVDRIGPSRILWGSDVPGVLAQCSYRQLVELGDLHSRFLTPEEQRLYLGETARSVYGFALSQADCARSAGNRHPSK